ncbi:MAG TPA: serine/threonine-protein kinase [Steroidobacteraceae bacterium]|jgi:serine/threonine-protein kinase|nr:serine/threonine-protein kinase [Steroidobacteraceae bacterium]
MPPHYDDLAWRTLSEHLDQALELADEARESWLRDLRAREPDLAAKLLELLQARLQQGYSEFLAGPPLIPDGGLRVASLIGRRVGPYVIEAELGRGGMGSVWRARRDDGRFEGVVAVKFVHAAWTGQAGEERFRIEGRLLGKLDHPNIARLLDAGMLDDTQPYLVLEHVQGEPIDVYCARNALGVKARVQLFLSVLAAVGHAHSHLIVHRDLKPANILITRGGTVKLLDFGIAKLLDADDPSASLTQSRLGPLTPQYAAPEQLLAQPVTTATDIYALGLVLYVCLTGAHPVPAGTRSSADLLRSVLTEEPARPSRIAAGAGIEPRMLEGDLDNVVGKALKKLPAERYLSAGEFAEDLRHHLNHEPVSAHADTIAYRLAKFARRHRTAVISGAAVAVALMATGTFAVVQLFEARAQRDLARREARHESAQNELTEFLLGDSLGGASSAAVSQKLNRARELIHRRFRTDPALQADLLTGLSGRYIDAGDAKGGAEVTNEAQAISRRIDDPELNADIACGRAEDAVETGNLALARQQEQIGRQNLRRMKVVSPGQAAECAMASAYIAEREENYGRATRIMSDAMKTLEQAGLERTSRYTSIAHEHARSMSLAGDFRGAWAAEQSVMAIVTDVGRDDSGAYYAMVNVAANALLAGGQPKRSLALLDATIGKSRKADPNAQLPFYLNASRLLDQSAAGIPDMPGSRAAALMQAAADAVDQGLLSALAAFRAGAIDAALDRGDLASADADWRMTEALEAKYLPDPAWKRDALRLLMAHARLLLAKQDPERAAQTVAQAVQLVTPERQGSDPQWRRLLALRAEVALAQHRYAGALADADSAVQRARLEAVDPNSSAWVGEALMLRARAELALGNKATAAAGAREALPHLEQNLDAAHPLLSEARLLAQET